MDVPDRDGENGNHINISHDIDRETEQPKEKKLEYEQKSMKHHAIKKFIIHPNFFIMHARKRTDCNITVTRSKRQINGSRTCSFHVDNERKNGKENAQKKVFEKKAKISYPLPEGPTRANVFPAGIVKDTF